jgi:biofilm PGA synthesis lipoprotein PgaB
VRTAALALLSACAAFEPLAPGETTRSRTPDEQPAPVPRGRSESPIEAERREKHFDEPAREAAVFREPLAPRADTRAIVLMYHGIDRRAAGRSVPPWEFEEHLVRLRDYHVEIIRLSQLLDFLEGTIEALPRRVAVLTIDDGEVLFHKYAWPLLLKYAAPFALGIITEPTEQAAHAKALDWDMLREMVASGLCEIASHGHTHKPLTGLFDPQAIDTELDLSRTLIESHTGFVPQAFIYPLGAFDEDIEARVAEAGYRAAFTAVGHPFGADQPRYRIPRFAMERGTAYESLTLFFEREHRAY